MSFDPDEVAGADGVVQLQDVGVPQLNTAAAEGLADAVLVVRAVDVDQALEGIAARPAVHALLEPLEGEHAREDEIRVAGLPAPPLPYVRDPEAAPAIALAAYELAPPGCDPRRREVALRDVAEVLDESAATLHELAAWSALSNTKLVVW